MIVLDDSLCELVQCHRPLFCDEYSKDYPAMLVSTQVEHRIEGGARITHISTAGDGQQSRCVFHPQFVFM